MTFHNYTTKLAGGLCTFPSRFMLDAHCSEYGREGRLFRIMYDTKDETLGTTFGINVDEDHALVVTDLYTSNPKGTVRIIYIPFIQYYMFITTQSGYWHDKWSSRVRHKSNGVEPFDDHRFP